MVRKPLVFPLFPTRDSAMPKILINLLEIDYFQWAFAIFPVGIGNLPVEHLQFPGGN